MTTDQISEDRIHQSCYMAFHNTYPQYRGLLCYNLNNSANAIQGNKNMSMGLQPGRSDMVLYWSGRAYHLEIKTPTGKQQPNQRVWEALIRANGFEYTIHRSVEDFMQRVRDIMGHVL